MEQRFGASCRRWTRAICGLGLGLILVGCQPQAIPSNPDRDPPPKTNGAGAAKSRATDATSTPAESPADQPAPTDSSSNSESGETKPSAEGATSAAPSGDAKTEDSAKGAGATGETAAPSSDTAEKKPTPRPAPRRPAAPGEPLEITFEDLVIGMQADVVYRPWMLSDRAKEVDGQKVKLIGYVHPGVDKQKHIKELVLLRNTECKFGPGGQADHLVRVFFKSGVEATFTQNAVEVQGVLKINPWGGPDGNTWSLYDLEGTAFKDLRRK